MKPSPLDEAIDILEAEWRGALHQQEVLREYSGESNRERRLARFSREPRLQDAVDEACRMWAQERRWPRMDAETTVFVYDRFEQAVVFASWIRKHHAEFPQRSAAQILVFLLVDYRFFLGRDRWHRLWSAGC